MLSTLRIENSPFNEQQLRQLQNSISGLSHAQSQWLSGFLAGRLVDSEQWADTVPPTPLPAESMAIIYATETGNSRAIAQNLAAAIEQDGLNSELHSMDSFRPAALRKLKHAAFVISTHGEGEPPDEALELFEYLENNRAPELQDLNYRILALGDRSYPLFCEAGRKLDARLQELGARNFGKRLECDVDYAATAGAYNDEIVQFIRDNLDTEEQPEPLPSNHLSLVPSASRWNRETPFSAEVQQIQKITGCGSDKHITHIELSLRGSDLQYQPGDALGVWASNDQQLVGRILETLHINPSSRVLINDEELQINTALTEHLEITRLTIDTVLSYANASGQIDLEAHFSGFTPEEKREFLQSRQLADLTEAFPSTIEAQVLADMLRPLSPRSYSIASSQGIVDDEVHLTVATLQSDAIGIPREGLASGYINHRLEAGDKLSVFLEPNTRFHLPDDNETPIIMIAAGTGVAPYRSFMQELESRGQSPDSWLIFGNPHLRTDFLYQKEWLHWRKSGLLNHIDTAWSRDQAATIYVQDLVREQAIRIENWLQRGVIIYICGSLDMGKAVQQAIGDVLIQQRGIDPDTAKETLAQLRRTRRIRKDLLMNNTNPVEGIKASSNYLRGTLKESLLDGATGTITENDTQLSKFHGIYQQDDRDVRENRRRQKLEPDHSFMIRARVPGGVCTPAQWLALDAIATNWANHSLRLTTRQAFQFHGVVKHDLKSSVQAINNALMDTIAACGDVNRNVMCTSLPELNKLHTDVYRAASSLSEHLTPNTTAYHEIWLDRKKLVGAGDSEPIYGDIYLPRKFKIAFAIPPSNDVDVLAHDLGFVATSADGILTGFTITVGGGMGATHGDPDTYPLLAKAIGWCSTEQVNEIGEAIVTIQRDFGDRSNRKHARFKYTVEDHGLPWLKEELENRLGFAIEQPRPFVFTKNGDDFGWQQSDDGSWHLLLFTENGRLADTDHASQLTGMREIAKVHNGDFRLTPNQNVVIANVDRNMKSTIDRLVEQHGLDGYRKLSRLRLHSIACVALPTCGQAMAEAERYLPDLINNIEELLERHRLQDQAITIRMTGCPNGCARPYLAEIGLVGKAPGRFNLHLGAAFNGTRLNRMILENADEQKILQTLNSYLETYTANRKNGEHFGDYFLRTGQEELADA